MLLEIENINVVRGKVSVLTVKYLQLRQRDILAIVGPNGAGKSTLLLLLARLIKPAEGTIKYRGKLANSEPDLTYRRRLGLVLQDPLLLDVSVFKNVAMGLKFRGFSKKAIESNTCEWLEKLGIKSLRDRRAKELSGGEAQRVSLARALVLKPELLLLDEPFAALDQPTRNKLNADLKVILNQAGITTVVVSHDINEATSFADRVGVILNGELLSTTSSDNLLDVCDERAKDFLRSVLT